jgi:hypothetical protein
LRGPTCRSSRSNCSRYLDEQSFRFNNRRETSDFDRFKLAASQVVGQRLTYAELSGKMFDTSAH